MSKKQKERKKVEKKKVAKQRVEIRRKKSRAELKKVREENKLQRKYAIKPVPFKKSDALPPSDMVFPYEPVENPAKDEAIKKRLEHNMKILEALQAEMDKEEFAREEANSKLEGDGATTMREKMDLLAKKAEGAMIQFDELGINEPQLNMNWNLNSSVDLGSVNKNFHGTDVVDTTLEHGNSDEQAQ